LKPQIGVLPILFVLLHRKDWKLLVVPAIVYLASFIHWGWWIPKWLAALRPIGDVGPFLASNVSLYPYGLVLLLMLLRYRSSLKIFYVVTEKNIGLSFFGFIFPLTFLAVEIWRTEKHPIRELHPAEEQASVVDVTVHEQP
jgi:hypothetical protein